MFNGKKSSEQLTSERINKWQPVEDQQLRDGITEFGEGCWTTIAK